MKKKFNITGLCIPEKHYMVNLDSRLEQIRKLIDDGDYFTINRARQYGKTTTLAALAKALQDQYIIASLDFQVLGNAKFKTENTFSLAFAKIFVKAIYRNNVTISEQYNEALDSLNNIINNKSENFELQELFEHLTCICANAPKPVVMIIDETDSVADNQVFIDFLAQLRFYFLERNLTDTATFKSVILAGVYNIKNIRKKIRPDEFHKENSPWNIATDFNIDMSFGTKDISGMLCEYETDCHMGMNIDEMSNVVYDYTSGYPFLVSLLCKLLDEEVAGSKNFPDKNSAWTKEGLLEAVKILLNRKNTLLESLINKLAKHPKMRKMVYALLFNGSIIPYNPFNKTIEIAEMFGFIKNSNENVVIANRIFETSLYNFFLSEEALCSDMYLVACQNKNHFIKNGHLDMRFVLEKFVTYFDDLYGDKKLSFNEDDGRRYFLLFLKPIINGIGNYYIEARTRNMERTDVIIDYLGEQFVIELKIWCGNAYNARGEAQLSGYLDYYHLNKGYMLSFNFNKNKQTGVREITIGDKILVEAVV